MATNKELNCCDLITFGESIELLKNQKDIQDLIVQDNELRTYALPWWKWIPSRFNLFCGLSRPARLSSDILNDKRLVYTIAKCQFNGDNDLHIQMLFTLYKKLNPDTKSCLRYGPHWESIGFQGNDPSTDFRGVGLLGLLLPLSLVTENRTLPFVIKVLDLSRDNKQGFPFMVLSLNVTQVALTALKDGLLDRLSCDSNSAIKALSQFYTAVLFFIYDKWQLEQLTLVDSGHLLKHAEKVCKKDLTICLRNCEKYLDTLVLVMPTESINEEIDPSQIQLDLHIS